MAEMPAQELAAAEPRPSYGFGGWYVAAAMQDHERVLAVCAQAEAGDGTTVCFLPDGHGQVSALGIKITDMRAWPGPSLVKVHCRSDGRWPDTDDDATFAAVTTPVFKKQEPAAIVLLLRDLTGLNLEDALPNGRMRISLIAGPPGSNCPSRYVFLDMKGFNVAWDALLARRHAAYAILTQV